MHRISLFILISAMVILPPIHVSAVESGDMSAEEIVQECERKTGFKASELGARAFIFRRCVQTIQSEKQRNERAAIKATHRLNLQNRGNESFLRRGTGDRTKLKRLRPVHSGVPRVFTDQAKFQSIQFNRGRAPDEPESPKDQKIERAKVTASQGRYERDQLMSQCAQYSGLRKNICMRSKLGETSTSPMKEK